MKLYCLLFTICIFFSSQIFVKAQGNVPSLKHVQGISSIGINGGYVSNGFNGGLGYTYYAKSKLLLRCKAVFESTKINKTGLTFIYLNPELMYSIIKLSNSVYFNIKAGPLVGYEMLSNSGISKKLNSVVYGGEVGLNAEFLLSSKIGLNLDYDQRLIGNSNSGSQSFCVTLGLAYFF
jgi:hypothetical protein